jgi:hypothetical protein
VEALQERKQIEKEDLERYVRSVFRARAGEVVTSRDGREYQVQQDGSLLPFRRNL